MLITLFTSISMNKTEPDLGVYGYRGDDVSSREGTYPPYGYRESMAWNEQTHGYSPFFQVSNLKKQGHGSIR